MVDVGAGIRHRLVMPGDTLRVVTFSGELTASSVEEALDEVLRAGVLGARVMVDCRTMSGYSPAARDTFVDWFRRHQGSIDSTAVVTDNLLWHMVVRAMSLASGQNMKPFDDAQAAEAWLRD